MTTENSPIVGKKKKSLVDKYDIPITHLDFSYINECSDISELEKIVKILRSNEEGSYPDLQLTAEQRLSLFAPESRLLRTISPVLTKNQISHQEWKSIEEELNNWRNDLDEVDKRLLHCKGSSGCQTTFPQIRRPSSLKSSIKREENLPKKMSDSKKVPSSTDYRKWDTYDADSECLKLDIEEERESELKLRKEGVDLTRKEEGAGDAKFTSHLNSEPRLSLEEKEIIDISPSAESLTAEEKIILAEKEKDKGNEFYKRKKFDDALRYYTRSIFLDPTIVCYNNRAATYLKQCKFKKALADLDIVIEAEPENVKARYRRAIALQHKNEFEKALEDILIVLKHEPKNVLATHTADQIRENCASLPRKVRIKVRDENNPSQLTIKEVTEKELLKNYQDIDYIEVNDNGLPKIMCNCNGRYSKDIFMNKKDPLKHQIKKSHSERVHGKCLQLSSSTQIKHPNTKVDSESRLFKSSLTKPLIEPVQGRKETGVTKCGAKRLEIVELEKIEEDEKEISSVDMTTDEPSRSCLVTDMRTTMHKKVSFSDCKDDDKEHQGNVAVIKPYTTDIVSVSKTKEEKMHFNMDVKAGSEKCNISVPDTPTYSTSNDEHINADRVQSPAFNPVSSNHSINSAGIDSDDDEPPESNTAMNMIQKPIDNIIETIASDFFPENSLVKCECGHGYKLRSSQFSTKWKELETSENPMENLGKLIHLVCPHQLSSAIGTTLDVDMLSSFINCISHHFDLTTEKDKILSYLKSISSLPRFRIAVMFLSQKYKDDINSLLKLLEPLKSNIREAFFGKY